jgi:protein O-GlcNAc transferase
MGIKVISFSLWGGNPKYTQGAVENARQVKSMFPLWESRFYCAKDVAPEVISELEKYDAKVIIVDEAINLTGMFWRLYVFRDPSVDLAIIRDTDSRLSGRESSFVKEWEESLKGLHVIRDHPYHSRLIMGGMWGARSDKLRDIKIWIKSFSPEDRYDSDQEFLVKNVYHRFLPQDLIVHGEFFPYESKKNRGKKIPYENYHFVGEVFDGNGIRSDDYLLIQETQNSFRVRAKYNLKYLFRKAYYFFQH